VSETTAVAVWTDFGGVLTPPLSHTMGVFCRRIGVPPEVLGQALKKVTARYGTDDVMLPIDTPLVTEAEWLAEVNEVLVTDHGMTPPELTTLADVWFDGRETNHAWADALREARARGAFVGMLSNMVPTWDEHWRRMVDPDELFDDVLLSYRVGHRKPSPGMFALAAERAGVPAGRCVLIDDLEHNCAGARAAGWQAIHFTDAAPARDRLLALLGELGLDEGKKEEAAR
jgi:putative hydrolase of the HAD superfamily